MLEDRDKLKGLKVKYVGVGVRGRNEFGEFCDLRPGDMLVIQDVVASSTPFTLTCLTRRQRGTWSMDPHCIELVEQPGAYQLMHREQYLLYFDRDREKEMSQMENEVRAKRLRHRQVTAPPPGSASPSPISVDSPAIEGQQSEPSATSAPMAEVTPAADWDAQTERGPSSNFTASPSPQRAKAASPAAQALSDNRDLAQSRGGRPWAQQWEDWNRTEAGRQIPHTDNGPEAGHHNSRSPLRRYRSAGATTRRPTDPFYEDRHHHHDLNDRTRSRTPHGGAPREGEEGSFRPSEGPRGGMLMTDVTYTGGLIWQPDGFDSQVKRLHIEPINPRTSCEHVIRLLQDISVDHNCEITRANHNLCSRYSAHTTEYGYFYTVEYGTREMAIYMCWQLAQSHRLTILGHPHGARPKVKPSGWMGNYEGAWEAPRSQPRRPT